MKDSSAPPTVISSKTVEFRFLDLPTEIRIQIYELLLADPSIILQYLFICSHFRSMFRNKTPPALSAQILRTCKQVALESAPILYGAPQFDCSNCILGVEKLQGQIGRGNFNLIKRIILDADGLHDVAGALRGEPRGGMYQNLESLTTTAHPLVDMSQPGWEFKLTGHAMAQLSLSAERIVGSRSKLNVLGQDSRKQNSRSHGDAIEDLTSKAMWRFATSQADLAQEEHRVDVARLSDLAMLLQRRTTEAILSMNRSAIPEPLVHGMRLIMYP